MIYSFAQGTTLVIVKDAILGKVDRLIPTMLNYQTHIEKGSMFNTPPVFAIYVSMLTLRWLKANGGIEWIEERNKTKAQLLYKTIDESPYFKGSAKLEDRSNMNVTFLQTEERLKNKFDQQCLDAGLNGLKGHRSVGGYRASMYNALPLKSVQVLVDIINNIEK